MRYQEREEVVVWFVGGGAEAVGGEEEGADVPADVWSETLVEGLRISRGVC